MPPDLPAFVPDFPTWFLLAVAGATIVWAIPKLLAFFIAAIADAVVDQMENRLAPRWSADFDDAVAEIHHELTTNGGESTVKDKVNATALAVHQIQQDIEPLLLEYQNRWDPPKGNPV